MPSQFTWSSEKPKSRVTSETCSVADSNAMSRGILLEAIGPNHGLESPPTKLRTTCVHPSSISDDIDISSNTKPYQSHEPQITTLVETVGFLSTMFIVRGGGRVRDRGHYLQAIVSLRFVAVDGCAVHGLVQARRLHIIHAARRKGRPRREETLGSGLRREPVAQSWWASRADRGGYCRTSNRALEGPPADRRAAFTRDMPKIIFTNQLFAQMRLVASTWLFFLSSHMRISWGESSGICGKFCWKIGWSNSLGMVVDENLDRLFAI